MNFMKIDILVVFLSVITLFTKSQSSDNLEKLAGIGRFYSECCINPF